VPQPLPSARELLSGLVGQSISTVTGSPNRVLEVRDSDVLVATNRSPAGQPVPIDWIESALERVQTDGEIEISVASLGHRSAFVGAVLLTLPGTQASSTSPPRIRLSEDAAADYRLAAAGELNIWWRSDPAQRFWLEITDRPDIGIDLHCPQRDAAGNRSPGYSLIWSVQHDDIVFHYDRNQQAITSWSRAVGEVVEGPVVWLSHRGSTRRRLGAARPQPGWWLDLEGPYPLDQPLTLEQLRASGATVRAVLDELEQRRLGSLYFPFFFYAGSTLRPMQPYLNKLPATLVAQLPGLNSAAATASATTALIGAAPTTGTQVGGDYRHVTVSSLPDARDPFSVDPAVVERGLRGHADTQNALADAITAAGMTPRSPTANDPNFDLAWEADGTTFVAEVKSITAVNEERQLRLGLGQVLRYQSLLAGDEREVVAVLVPERPPHDSSWQTLCDDLGVLLVAPPSFNPLFR
jgi:hypothetical protein